MSVCLDYDDQKDSELLDLTGYELDTLEYEPCPVEEPIIQDHSVMEEEDGSVKFTVGYMELTELTKNMHANYVLDVCYPPTNMSKEEVTSNWFVNPKKRAAALLNDVPTYLNEVDLAFIFADYIIERIIVVRRNGVPTGNVFVFGPLYFMQLVVAWAPNVRLCKQQISATLISDVALPDVFPQEVIRTIFSADRNPNRILYFEQK